MCKRLLFASHKNLCSDDQLLIDKRLHLPAEFFRRGCCGLGKRHQQRECAEAEGEGLCGQVLSGGFGGWLIHEVAQIVVLFNRKR